MKIECIKADGQKTGKMRIAAYCRVSTGMACQEDSLETQMKSYQKRIQLRSDWELVGIYADSLSGLSAEKRPDFMRMIADCKAGKIDRILCKSVSRFSRNVVECQRYIELLRSLNIVVEFEKENIHTDDPKSHLFFGLMCSIAQDESHSTSENIRLGLLSKFQKGEHTLGNHRILGYDSVDGKLVPNEDAWIIRMIYDLFLEGKSFPKIARSLEEAGAKTLRNNSLFSGPALLRILRNETYVGDKHIHKQAPKDFITKKPLRESEYKRFYLKNCHEPIIDREKWDEVQRLLGQRDESRKSRDDVNGRKSSVLSGKVVCDTCGESYERYIMNSTEKYKTQTTYVYWRCIDKRRPKDRRKGCHNRNIREEDLLQMITEKMGWKSFDEKRFDESVERVVIDQKDITVVRK